MKNVNHNFGLKVSRRRMLRAGGVALGLPLLDAMTPAFAVDPGGQSAKRFVSVSLALGLHAPNFVPKDAGRGYQASRYLQSIDDLREKFTVISSSSNPGVSGGHIAEGSILSACPNARGTISRNTISLDQLMAKNLGHQTRFPSLVLNTSSQHSPSYTEGGAMIPAENDALRLFAKLFVNDSPTEQQRQTELIREGQSVLDLVQAETKALRREVGPGDRNKLDAWFTSIRELEQRLVANESWVRRPKPQVDFEPPAQIPQDNEVAVAGIILDIIRLALATDSTRFVTLHVNQGAVRGIEGVDDGYHNLSHHGRNADKLRQLAIVEYGMVSQWGAFLRKLKADNLLDETMVLLTSNLGNASNHDNRNMPVLIAGGRFKHGQHLAFDQNNNYPLPNLYVSMLQNVGIETDRFSTSTRTMTGLERHRA